MTYEQLLKNLADRDERLVVMTAENRAAIRGLPPLLGNRFIDTGITEQTMVGAAAGLALRGRIPVAHALACFLTMRAYEFIRTDVGISGLPVKLVGYVPGLLSEANGPTHQAIEDVAIMRGVPPLNVYCPADFNDLMIGIEKILLDPRPWYIRYTDKPHAVEHSTEFEIGKAEQFGTGTDIALLTYGEMFRHAFQAREMLEAQGKSVRLINLRTLKPLDEEAVLNALRNCALTVTIEDHFRTGGLYSIVAELALENRVAAHVEPICLNNKWFKPALMAAVLEYEKLRAVDLVERIMTRFNALG